MNLSREPPLDGSAVEAQLQGTQERSARQDELPMAMQQASPGKLLDGDLDAVARGEVVGRVGQIADQLVDRELDGVKVDDFLDQARWRSSGSASQARSAGSESAIGPSPSSWYGRRTVGLCARLPQAVRPPLSGAGRALVQLASDISDGVRLVKL
jgi:hypothetical protein